MKLDAWASQIGTLSTMKSELERWYFLNPLERARLKNRVEKQHLMNGLKTLATTLMVGAEVGGSGGGGDGGGGGGGGIFFILFVCVYIYIYKLLIDM